MQLLGRPTQSGAVLREYDVWIYGNDGFVVMDTGPNSSGILCYFWCLILNGLSDKGN